MGKVELAPCGECGHSALLRQDDIGWYVRCVVDFCDNCTEYFDTPEEASRAWNQRQKGAREVSARLNKADEIMLARGVLDSVLEENANIVCLEDIIRRIDDPKPYALKVAKELRKQSIGNKVVMDDAAECLVDDCREFKNIVKKLRNIVRRMKKRHLTWERTGGRI